jgi:hypothetical protein
MVDDAIYTRRSGFGARARTERDSARLQRDRAIERVRRVRGGTIAGAAGLTAGFAALVSVLAPGHSLAAGRRSLPAATKTPTSTAKKSAAVMPPLANPATLGLGGSGASAGVTQSQPASPAAPAVSPAAAAAPTTAPSAPAVVSGGS